MTILCSWRYKNYHEFQKNPKEYQRIPTKSHKKRPILWLGLCKSYLCMCQIDVQIFYHCLAWMVVCVAATFFALSEINQRKPQEVLGKTWKQIMDGRENKLAKLSYM